MGGGSSGNNCRSQVSNSLVSEESKCPAGFGLLGLPTQPLKIRLDSVASDLDAHAPLLARRVQGRVQP